MVQTDNTLRQRLIDKGIKKPRNLNVNAHVTHVCLQVTHFMAKFDAQCFTNPQYELVALHPDHFLQTIARSLYLIVRLESTRAMLWLLISASVRQLIRKVLPSPLSIMVKTFVKTPYTPMSALSPSMPK